MIKELMAANRCCDVLSSPNDGKNNMLLILLFLEPCQQFDEKQYYK